MTAALTRPDAGVAPAPRHRVDVRDLPADPVLHAALDRIARECSVRSTGAFVCGGDEIRRADDDRLEGDAWLTATLTRELYRRFYLGADSGLPQREEEVDRRPLFAREDPELGRRLRAANACVAHWEPGWRVVAAVGDGWTVVRDGLRLHVTADEVRPSPPADGASVAVRFPAERPFASPGFYLTVSSRGPVEPGERLARWYFAVTADTAPVLLGALTTALERRAARFVTKVLNDPAGYPRPDAAVLYVRRSEVAGLAGTVREVAGAPGIRLGVTVPLFSRRLAAGLAIADDPGPVQGRPMSFGQHRCSLVANGLRDAGPESTPAERREAVLAALRAGGIDPVRPHLNPGADEFDLEESR